MIKNWIINLIKTYQKYHFFGEGNCRFIPTCSNYTIEAIKKYGILKGFFLGIIRVLRCNPLFKGGVDPLK